MRISSALLEQFGRFVEAHTGLHLPVGRESTLLRGMDAIARDLGCGDVESCVRDLMCRPVTRPVIGLLAAHFAVGETYFFREPAVFQALEYEVLPQLIAARRAVSRRLCIWSAGCCTGEEAYSMAIVLDRLIPHQEDWDISIVGTDINPDFLQKAEQGIYRDWSFRDVPPWIRKRYFDMPEAGCHVVQSAIRRPVRFRHLNLIEDVYPSGIDILLCRNVLMYFGADNAARVTARLRDSLAHDGWLVTSAAEAGRDLFSGFSSVRFPDAVFYRRASVAAAQRLAGDPAIPARDLGGHDENAKPKHEGAMTVLSPNLRSALAGRTFACKPGRLRQREPLVRESLPRPAGGRVEWSEPLRDFHVNAESRACEAMARARSCADLGLLPEADRWCEAAIAIDKCNAGLRYLRATIAEQQGQTELALALLRQTIYLDQDFVLAHVALAGLCRRCGQPAAARRHYANAVKLLQNYEHDAVLPDAEGVSAGWLFEMLRATVEASDEDAPQL